MTQDREAALGYCRSVLLPIWERWTDGNLAMRRALDCESADPLTHEECRNRLFAAQQGFHGRGKTPDNLAAGIAAQAVLFALVGYPPEMVEQVGAKGVEVHEFALRHAPKL